MADLLFLNLFGRDKIQYKGVFKIAAYESGITISENKMTDPTWRTVFPESSRIYTKFGDKGFLMSLITILFLKL